jgi:hypothetical protein
MKSRILKDWDAVRIIWLLIGTGIGIAALVDNKPILLFAALYFMIGAIANVGCFAGRCSTNFTQKQSGPGEIEHKEIHSEK